MEQKRIRNFLKQIESGKINSGQAQAFFYRLEKNLAIQDPKLRAARRLVGEWDTLNTTQRQLAATQLTKYYRLNARRSDGNNVKTDIRANNIAKPVNNPKYIVGIKFDKIRIEKPKTIVIEVFKIATPTVE